MNIIIVDKQTIENLKETEQSLCKGCLELKIVSHQQEFSDQILPFWPLCIRC